jgi:putative transposase
MITPSHDLPVTRQAQVLGISRGAFYYKARPVPPRDLAIMRRIDELHLERPFAGSRMLRDMLNREGVPIGRRHVASLMKRMGIAAIYRRPNSSKPAPGHKIYPYLLRGTKIDRPDQVWATDITYIPMARGFVYLVAIVDWFSRRVLAHRVSITLGPRSGPRRTSASTRWKRRSAAMANRRSSIRIRAASSPARHSAAFCSEMASPSAWMAKGRGATTCLSNGSGSP